MREGESVERVGRLGQRMNGLMGNRPDIQGRYSTADAVWDSTGRGHRGREGEDTHISKFVVCMQWRNLPFSALHTLIMTCTTTSQPEWLEKEELHTSAAT